MWKPLWLEVEKRGFQGILTDDRQSQEVLMVAYGPLLRIH